MIQKIKSFLYPIKFVFLSIPKLHYYYFLLTIIPVIYLLNTFVVHSYYGVFYLSTIDPEYFHLFNGIAIGGGNLSVEYTDHPGTPLEFLVAITARIVHLFQSNSCFVKDFIDDPEKFIHASNLSQNLIMSVTLFLGSVYFLKKSSSLILSFFFLLIPFSSTHLWELSGRVIPESFIIWPILLELILVLKYIFTKPEDYKIQNEWVLWGAVFGLGFACKISFVSMFFLPLVLVKSKWKEKISYVFYVLLAVMLFAYPVVFNFGKFKDWMISVVTHSGIYGTGEKGFIDTTSIIPNFMYVFNDDTLLFILILVSILLCSLTIYPKLFKNIEQTQRIVRSIIAVNIALLLILGITLKHFNYHYFMPYFIIKFFLIIQIYLLLKNLSLVEKYVKLRIVLAVLVLAVMVPEIYSQKLKFDVTIANLENRNAVNKQKQNEIIQLVKKNTPIIISAPYFGCPFPTHAINGGYMVTYKLKGFFKESLLEKYPYSFMYFDWSDKFYHWDNFIDMNYILDRANDEIFVYLGELKTQDLGPIEDRIFSVINKEDINKEIVYSDTITGEKLIKYSFSDSTSFASSIKPETVSKN